MIATLERRGQMAYAFGFEGEYLEFTCAIPPSTNNAYSTQKRGKKVVRVLSEEGRDYKEKAGWVAKAEAMEQGFTPLPGKRFAFMLVLHFPDDRYRRDLDNRIKLLLDSVSSALGFDDSRVDVVIVMRGIPSPQPYCQVTLAMLDGSNPTRRIATSDPDCWIPD